MLHKGKLLKSLVLTATVATIVVPSFHTVKAAEVTNGEFTEVKVEKPLEYEKHFPLLQENNLKPAIESPSTISPNSVPSQGGTGGGGYSQVFHQYGSSRNAQNTIYEIASVLAGKGLGFIGVNWFAGYLASSVLAHSLIDRPVVYYKVSTYITNTATRGRQVRSTILVYSDSARTKLISQNTRLAYEY